MPTFFSILGLAAIILFIFSLIWLRKSKGKKEKMLIYFFLFLSLMVIFVCIYEYCQFNGFMRCVFICEIGAIMSLFLSVFFFIKSLRFGNKIEKDINKIRQNVKHINA